MPVIEPEKVGEFSFTFPSYEAKFAKGEIASEKAIRIWGLDWMDYESMSRLKSIQGYGPPGDRHEFGGGPVDLAMLQMYSLIEYLRQPSTEWNVYDADNNIRPMTMETLKIPRLFDEEDLFAAGQYIMLHFLYDVALETLNEKSEEQTSSTDTPNSESIPSPKKTKQTSTSSESTPTNGETKSPSPSPSSPSLTTPTETSG